MIVIPLQTKPGDHLLFSWDNREKGKQKKEKINGYEVIVKSIDDNHFCIHSVLGDYDMYFQKELINSLNATCKKM